MEDSLLILQSIVFTLVLNGLLCFGAYRVAQSVRGGRTRGQDGFSDLDRLVVMLATIAVVVPGVTVGLGAVGFLGRWTSLAAVFCFAVASTVATWNAARRRFLGPLVLDVLDSLRTDRLLVFGLLPGVIAMALLVSWAAVRPSYGFDPLNYHLPLVAAVLRSGSFTPLHFPPYFETFPYFTMTGDMFSLWALTSTGDTSLLPLANMAPFALLAVVFYGFLRDFLPSRAPAAVITTALLTVPAFFVLLTDAYVEIPLWAFLFGSLRLIVLSARNGHHRGLFVLASFLCGAMLGAKLTGFPMAMILFVAWLLLSRGQGVAWHFRRFFMFVGGAALFGAYFYVRNLVLVGSPVYPFPMSVGGVQVFAGDADHAARVGGTTIRRFLAPLVFSGELFKAIFGTRTPPNSSWGLGATGPFFVLAAFLASFGVYRSARRRVAVARDVVGRGAAWMGPLFLVASLVSIVVYIYLPWCAPYLFGNVRFVYPAVPFAAFALISIPAVAEVKRWALVVFAVALQALSFVAASVPVQVPGVLATLVFLAVAVLIVAFSRKAPVRRFAAFIGPALVLVVLVCAVCLRLDPVEAYRNPGSDSGPTKWASERAECLDSLDKLVPDGRFALTMARGAPHAWFIFPLLGERMQREPVYVDISPDGPSGNLKCADSWPGWPGADKALWMRGIAVADVEALVIMNDDEDVDVGRSPVELQWVAEDPDHFQAVLEGRFCRVYRLSGFGTDGAGAR